MNSILPFLIMSCMLSETVDSVSVSADKTSPENGDKVILTCSITGFNAPASWSNNATGAVLTSCFSGGPCSPISVGNYSFSANATAIFVQIYPFASSDDFGWKCQHDINTTVFKFALKPTSKSRSLASPPCWCTRGWCIGVIIADGILVLAALVGIGIFCWRKKHIKKQKRWKKFIVAIFILVVIIIAIISVLVWFVCSTCRIGQEK